MERRIPALAPILCYPLLLCSHAGNHQMDLSHFRIGGCVHFDLMHRHILFRLSGIVMETYSLRCPFSHDVVDALLFGWRTNHSPFRATLAVDVEIAERTCDLVHLVYTTRHQPSVLPDSARSPAHGYPIAMAQQLDAILPGCSLAYRTDSSASGTDILNAWWSSHPLLDCVGTTLHCCHSCPHFGTRRSSRLRLVAEEAGDA